MNGNQDRNEGHNRPGDRRESEPDRPAQARSLAKAYLLPGLVALVCGVAGAWGYWHFFGSAKSGEEKSSGKNSDSSKSSDSSQQDSGKAEVQQANAAWEAATKELRQALDREKAARRSEQELKAIMDFLSKTLLSAGRPGDVSLAEAFRAGGQGRDVTLRKAVDLAESQVAAVFADRPLAEASVREMLGLAYLNLGDAAAAVKQYERAFELRQAMQGVDQPDTAACRNQLAVAYRLAGRTDDAARLFDRNPYSPDQASALAVAGSMLLLQKKPAEAELKLRACLNIRRKIQPDDWVTFETMSMLGEALSDQRKFAEAEPLLTSGYEGMKRREDAIPPQDKPRLTKALERLVKLYEAWGKKDQAMRWRKDLEAAEATKKS